MGLGFSISGENSRCELQGNAGGNKQDWLIGEVTITEGMHGERTKQRQEGCRMPGCSSGRRDPIEQCQKLLLG